MFSHAIYGHYSDNVAPDATITAQTGTPSDGYPVEWVADRNAARPSKLDETTGAWMFEFDDPVQILIAAIFHANFEEDLPIRIQANATDSWGAPSLNETILMPPWRGRFPGQPWIDLSAVTGAGAYLFWRVALLTANAVPLAVGDIWLGTAIRTLPIQWNDKLTVGRPQIEHETDYRKSRFSLGTTRRLIVGTIPAADAVRDEVVDWIIDADGRPVLFIPEHSATPPEAWLALHTQPMQQITETFDAANFLPLAMEEDGRGLEPTPSPLP